MAVFGGYYGADNGQVPLQNTTGEFAAQTFVVDGASNITDVEVLLYRVGNPTMAIIALYDVVEGLPDSAVYSVGIDASELSTDTAGAWYKAKLGASGVNISAGTYAIVVTGGDDASNSVHVRGRLNDGTYPHGQRYHSANPLITWDSYPNDDLVFKLHGTTEGSELIYAEVDFSTHIEKTKNRLVAVGNNALYYEDID